MRLCLPPGLRREALLGDLAELWTERVERQGRSRADLWYAGQALGTALRYGWERIGRLLGTTKTGGGGMEMEDGARALIRAARRLRRTPVHTVGVVATLALGMGATAAVFSVVSGVLLEPLPYPDPQRIVSVYEDNTAIDMPPGFTSVPNFQGFQEEASAFEALAIFRGRSTSVVTDGPPEYAYGAFVSPDFFTVFGTEPLLGRGFRPEETAGPGDALVILGHGLWTRGFGADPDILGTAVAIDGVPHTVVGVMPAGFQAHGDWVGVPVQLWRPFGLGEGDARSNRSYHVAGRLREGVSLDAARAEMEALHHDLAAAFPDANAGWELRMVPWDEMIVGGVRPALWLLLATVGLVLAIACANAANLSVNRALSRSRELATRLALGAGRARLVFMTLRESLLLSACGGLLGLVLATGSLHLLKALDPGRLPRLAQVGLDVRVVGFSFLLVVLSALVFGGITAGVVLRADPARRFRTWGGGGGAPRHRLRSTLAVLQLVVSFALVAGAGLLLRSLNGLVETDLGFDPRGVTALTVALSWDRVETLEARTEFSRRLLEELQSLPGVRSAGMINSLPLSGSSAQSQVEIQGVTDGDRLPAVAVRGISPGYLETMGIEVLEGRDLTAQDVRSPGAVLVNRTMARLHWPDGRVLGAQVRQPGDVGWHTVVGVVDDVLHYGPNRPVRPELYNPYSDEYLTSKSFVVRTAAGSPLPPRLLREAVGRVDPAQPVREVRSMEEWASQATAEARFQAVMTASAAGLATVLAWIGLFATLASLVGERTREIAVRMAVGAPGAVVMRGVLRKAGTLVALGLAGGWAVAWALGGVLERFLFGVGPRDASVLSAAAASFVLVALLAALLPARRAASVDPARILREE